MTSLVPFVSVHCRISSWLISYDDSIFFDKELPYKLGILRCMDMKLLVYCYNNLRNKLEHNGAIIFHSVQCTFKIQLCLNGFHDQDCFLLCSIKHDRPVNFSMLTIIKIGS